MTSKRLLAGGKQSGLASLAFGRFLDFPGSSGVAVGTGCVSHDPSAGDNIPPVRWVQLAGS